MPRLPTIVDNQQIIAQAGLLTDQPAGIREDDPESILIVPEKKQGGPAWRVRLPEIGWIVGNFVPNLIMDGVARDSPETSS